MLAGVAVDPEGPREDHRREDLGQVVDGVEGLSLHQLVDQRRRLGVEHLLERSQRLGGHGSGDDGPVLAVERRVDLEEDARLPPRVLLRQVGQADSGGGREPLVVAQDGVDIIVSGDGPDPVPGKVDRRPRIPELRKERKRIGEEGVCERVDVRDRPSVSVRVHVPILAGAGTR